MRRILLVFLALGALFLPDVSRAGSCNSANGCATLEHDSTTNAAKTVNVDSTGTVLAGGSGSRVELIASGTHTTVTAAQTTVVDCVLPVWAHSVQFSWYVPTAGLAWGGAGAVSLYAANLSVVSGSTYGSPLTLATTASPPTSQGGTALLGPAFALGHGTVTSVGSNFTYGSPFVLRTVRFSRAIATAAPTSWNFEYACYGIGG